MAKVKVDNIQRDVTPGELNAEYPEIVEILKEAAKDEFLELKTFGREIRVKFLPEGRMVTVCFLDKTSGDKKLPKIQDRPLGAIEEEMSRCKVLCHFSFMIRTCLIAAKKWGKRAIQGKIPEHVSCPCCFNPQATQSEIIVPIKGGFVRIRVDDGAVNSRDSDAGAVNAKNTTPVEN